MVLLYKLNYYQMLLQAIQAVSYDLGGLPQPGADVSKGQSFPLHPHSAASAC